MYSRDLAQLISCIGSYGALAVILAGVLLPIPYYGFWPVLGFLGALFMLAVFFRTVRYYRHRRSDGPRTAR